MFCRHGFGLLSLEAVVMSPAIIFVVRRTSESTVASLNAQKITERGARSSQNISCPSTTAASLLPSFNHADQMLSEPSIQSCRQTASRGTLTATHSIMDGKLLSQATQDAACRAHNFSSSKLSTSFATKPPCRPTLRPPLACHFYRCLPIAFNHKLHRRLE